MSELRLWQQWVIEEVAKNIKIREDEENQSLSDYDLNKLSQIKIKLPKKSGHTFLTAYLSTIYDCVIIHRDVEHWEEIAAYRKGILEKIDTPTPKCTIISVYELFYATHFATLVQKPLNLLSTTETLKKRIVGQRAVIVDMASSIPQLAEDFVLSVATGPLIFLD